MYDRRWVRGRATATAPNDSVGAQATLLVPLVQETIHRAAARRTQGLSNHRALPTSGALGLRALHRFEVSTRDVPLLFRARAPRAVRATELKRRTRLYPWPTKVGIDEHLFKHDFRLEQRRFVTMVVDHKNKRLMELVEGKSGAELTAALQHIPGRENMRWVTLDMSDSYRSFA